MGTIGPRLRAAREARNLSVEQAADDTRISLRFLEALEREEFEALPAPVYVRGFLRSYANYLGLEPQSLLDALNGENAAEALPTPYVRGPDRRERRPAPPPQPTPVAQEAVMPAEPEPDSEWDPEPDQDEEWYGYEDDGGDYRPQPVPGVLVERGYVGSGSGGSARTVMLAGVAIIALIAVVAAAFTLQGGGGDGTQAGENDEPTATTGTSGAGRTVIPVGSATVEGTQPADGTVVAGETPGTDETPEPTSGAGTAETPTPAATSAPGATATPTETPSPSLTPTPVPPTPTPIPTATVQPHPFQLDECTAGAGTTCGTPPYRVICAPDGWFVDKDNDYPKPPEWQEFTVDSTFGIGSIASGTCGL